MRNSIKTGSYIKNIEYVHGHMHTNDNKNTCKEAGICVYSSLYGLFLSEKKTHEKTYCKLFGS